MSLNMENLIKSTQFSEFLFNNISPAILLVDQNFKVKKINDSFASLFSKEEREVFDQLCGNSLGCSFAIEQNKPCGSTSECSNCMIRSCLVNGLKEIDKVQSAYVSRKFYINDEPISKYFRLKIKHVLYDDENMAIITIDDITELEEQKNQIKDLANRDYLTGLYNRRYLYEIGEPLLENAKRGHIYLAVAMVDIDFFKKINDKYGHAAGDFILKSVTDIFNGNIRKSDIVARIGGEEFCFLLNVKEHDESFMVLEKIRKTIERHKFLYEQIEIPVTISCGITDIIQETLDFMIKKADEFLYEAKEIGRNRVVIGGKNA